MDICHITLTSERDSRLPLFPDEGSYREALHRLGAACRGCLALFALIAEHLHLVVLRSRREAGRLAQATSLTLRPVARTSIAPGHCKMVETRSHMRWLLRYLLEQPTRHGMPGHPACWVGSCFADLAGARSIEGLSLRIEEALPEYSLGMALNILRLPGATVAPADRTQLRAAGAHRLTAVAAAAFGAGPSLQGNTSAARTGRRAVVQLAHRVGIPCGDVTDALNKSPRTVWRLRRPELPYETLLIPARRLTLETMVQRALEQGGTLRQR